MPKPYIGITGAVNINEANNLVKEFYETGYDLNSPHLPMLGYLVSYKTLKGEETKNKRYVKFNDLREILLETKDRAFNMIHYYSRENSSLAEQVNLMFNKIYHQGLCRALQLNVDLPDRNELKFIKKDFEDIQIVFQASKNVLKLGIKDILSELKKYGSSIDYVLIDSSGGSGRNFEINGSLDLYKEIKSKLPNLIVGFAGGFNPENVFERSKELTERIGSSNFSIDAESGLRDKLSNDYGDDILNIEKVRKFLKNSSQIL